ncbi:MAG: SUMF1/EgtB/PvdO family nonheme iron enzyme [Muribaculaceae bacterium]|nr:SUMF1/EgtB/PvdO family nonheme iron enzyme [Muribaculaceae bacterium]
MRNNKKMWLVGIVAVLLVGMAVTVDAKVKKGKTRTTTTRNGNNGKKPSSSKNLTFTVNGVKFEMVPVEGGTTKTCDPIKLGAGSKDVTLESFYIGQTEVTQALWEAVMGNNPSCYKDPEKPVTDVSWEDCNKFIEELNKLTGKKFRLPSFAEWNFACKGGNQSKGYEFSGSNDIDKVAWYIGNSDHQIQIVATKEANELGIYDMIGNVSEWTSNFDDGIRAKGHEKGRCPPSAVVVGGDCHTEANSVYIINQLDVYRGHMSTGLRLAL